MSRRKPLRSFIVRVRSTIIEDYVVNAENESDAKVRVNNGDGEFCNEVERPLWEVEEVVENT